MLEALLFAFTFIAVAQLWSKMASVEQRLREVELGAPVAAPAFPDSQPRWREAAPVETPAAPASEYVQSEAAEERPSGFGAWREPPAEPPHRDESESLAEAESTVPQSTQAAFGFEELFGRRLPIWAGGITLAVAGVLIVRYSIETGLLSPLVRVLSGLMFGAGLIAAAEAAVRNEVRVDDPRIPQSLAGAGIASLYASILVAVNLYALVGPLTAFVGMAAVTALAMVLSLRFGPASALLGLVGGLAAPALIGAGEPDVPLLTLYLALAVGGLAALSRVQRWAWLGISALIGGLGWGAALLLAGALDVASTLSVGLYVLLVGFAVPFFALAGRSVSLVRLAGCVAAAAQIAALVATGGFALLNWGLFGLVSIAILFISRRSPTLRPLPAVGLAIALLLLGAWTDPGPGRFALVLMATVAIYGVPLLIRLWRPAGDVFDSIQIAGLALAASLLASFHFYRADGSVDLALAAVALAAACLPALAALLGWRCPGRRDDPRFALLSSTAALLVAVAAAFAAPIWLLPLLIGALAAALLSIGLTAQDERLEYSAWTFAAGSVLLLVAAPAAAAECDRLAGLAEAVQTGRAVLRWASLACVAAFFAWRARLSPARVAAQAAAALLAYGAAAQILSGSVLPVVTAAALPALIAAGRLLPRASLLPAAAALLAVAMGWAALPMLEWAQATLPAVGGDPVFVGELPSIRDVLLRLLIPAALIGAALRIGGGSAGVEARRIVLAGLALVAAVGLHVLFKQLFAIGSDAMFVQLGLAERTLWQALLAAAAIAAWRLGAGQPALALGLAALAHFGLFSLLLHNPLHADQAVGAVPVFNLLVPSYGLALALLWAGPRLTPEFASRFERARAVMQMLLIVLLAYSLLRQAAEGSILIGTALSAGEDIARSILAVVLAIGFLLWGIRTGARDWRIASLVLMLAAVAKVFLLDASGLEGLLRIASFVALGASLIGIGWLYSRSLGGADEASASSSRGTTK